MSDILIKNIGTLKESTPITLYPNGYWEDYTTGESGEFVELPTSHGRLIDCDEVFQRLKWFSICHPEFQEKIDSDFCALVRWLVTAKTIIEAERTQSGEHKEESDASQES